MKLSRAVSVILALALIGLWSNDADARSRHERVKISGIKKDGKTVGLRIKMTLRPEDHGHTIARVGLAPDDKKFDTSWNSNWRNKIADPKKGHLLHQFKPFTKLVRGTPKEVTVEVLYKDQPKLKPGTNVNLVSAWSDKGAMGGYWHVWGLQTFGGDKKSVIKLPGSAKDAAAAAKEPAAAKKPAAKKPAAKKPAAKKPAAKKPAAKKPAAKKPAAKKPAAKKPAAKKPRTAARNVRAAGSTTARSRAAKPTATRSRAASTRTSSRARTTRARSTR